ncbi:ribosome maturation factor RimP [Chryseolinea sp. H1M3-3]|uniref:ribosome maturation factor RimP n=1 Tax=Chryseolinea sp. H1M3-3 TaxID=3034144 RepID=UPI0023EC9635|nr:ribosome maturation factor RimP [Chryseolinea sp. H1M3-3]
MEFIEELKKIITGKLTDPSQFLVDVIAKGQKSSKKVLIVIDGDKGVTIDDCANLSRELSKAFDDAQLFDDSYMLEVSTPGLDHPLKLQRQYNKNIGRRVKVATQQGSVEGKLVDVGEEKITIEQEIGTGKHTEIKKVEILFSEIDKTFVLVSFK